VVDTGGFRLSGVTQFLAISRGVRSASTNNRDRGHGGELWSEPAHEQVIRSVLIFAE
jgi:hypothetical protein